MDKNENQKILITDDVHPYLIEGLTGMGYEICYRPTILYSDIFPIISEFDGIIINSKVKMTRELMGLSLRSPKSGLQFIGRLGSGLEIIDLMAAKEMGIKVFSAPEGNRNAVAEHALGMLLCLANQLQWADRDVRKLDWNRESRRGFELEGRSVGIIGFGNNGSAFAQKLKGMGMKVLSYDKYKKNYVDEFSHVQECMSLQDIVDQCEIISLHIPLTEETKHLVDEKFIDQCQDGAIIINTARGKCIETNALIRGLEQGKLRGACLDVFENEKPSTFTDKERIMYDKLYQLHNVVLSPHVAGWTVESKFKIADSLLDQIGNFIDQS